jgi:NAD(P)-dependent dehydrogenase (short-subunit alcohol dehydrogenase family)
MNAMGIPKDKIVEIEREAAKKYPLGRIGESQDIANGVLYLASDESSFVTGIDLVLDGGGQYI